MLLLVLDKWLLCYKIIEVDKFSPPRLPRHNSRVFINCCIIHKSPQYFLFSFPFHLTTLSNFQ